MLHPAALLGIGSPQVDGWCGVGNTSPSGYMALLKQHQPEWLWPSQHDT